MKVKRLEDLVLADFGDAVIWVDYESAGRFYEEFSPDTVYAGDEDYVVPIPRNRWPIDLFVLQDVGRFYAHGSARVSSGAVRDGFVVMRASDLTPYLVEIFCQSGRQQISLPSGLTSKDENEKMSHALNLGDVPIYPVTLNYSVEGLALRGPAEFG